MDAAPRTSASSGGGGGGAAAADPQAALRRSAREAVGLRLLEKARLRERAWWMASAAVSVVAALIALLFPHMRQPLALFAGAALLLWLRTRFFPVQGLRTTPFSGVASLGGLLSGAGARKQRRD